eukprot:m.207545 g.207545  ORF g.207545 m.207545 type:complete len:439 (-) comp23802_c0_seq1:279-1595(-)
MRVHTRMWNGAGAQRCIATLAMAALASTSPSDRIMQGSATRCSTHGHHIIRQHQHQHGVLLQDADGAPVVADFRPLEDNMDRWMEQFKSGPGVGEYSYFPHNVTSVYGSADMLMTLFVLGRGDSLTDTQRDAWAAVINRFQDPETGLYLAQSFEPHYGPARLGCCDHEHTTAFAVASLALIGRRPRYHLTLFDELQRNKSAWEGWLSNVPTEGGWDHRASGVYAALAMTSTLVPEFHDFYFEWLSQHADPASGFVCPGEVIHGATPKVGWMTCYAHISWQYVYSNETWPHAAAMTDAVLAMQNTSTGWFCVSPGGGNECTGTTPPCHACTPNGCCGSASPILPSCHQLDGLWVAAQSSVVAGGYRHGDVVSMCRRFLTGAVHVLGDTEGRTLFDPVVYGDSHGLNGALQAVAACAEWFPELVMTHRPWHVTVESAPFM